MGPDWQLVYAERWMDIEQLHAFLFRFHGKSFRFLSLYLNKIASKLLIARAFSVLATLLPFVT
jgi:hypothetical protein